MADIDSFQRVIALAERAGALKQQLKEVEHELESLAGEVAGEALEKLRATSPQGHAPTIVGASSASRALMQEADDEPKASLAARVLSVFRKHPSQAYSAPELAKTLSETAPETQRLIGVYLARFAKDGQIKRAKRGKYTLSGK